MGCREETSNICIETTDARCVDYTGKTNSRSEIKTGCVNQHMVNEELYTQIEGLSSEIDTGIPSLTETPCIEYTQTDGKVLPRTVMKKHREEICSLKDRVHTLEVTNYAEMDITDFGLDFKCLVDPCGDPITNLGQLLQIIINKSCNGGSTPGGGLVEDK